MIVINKNTKKTLVTYLNNMLTSSCIINLINSKDKNEEMTQELLKFMKSIQQKANNSISNSLGWLRDPSERR